MKGHCALVLVLAVCCGLCAPTRTCDFAHAASVPEVRRRRDGQWDREGRVECAVCCLLWSFVALWVMCIAGSCCVCCGGRAVHDAGSGAACSRAEVGRRVRVACWARARRSGAMEADLGGDSGTIAAAADVTATAGPLIGVKPVLFQLGSAVTHRRH